MVFSERDIFVLVFIYFFCFIMTVYCLVIMN
uniref:Uncharacterized protein n=1 Tax=Rhizophora mucronata TaxID=61149 RepID=A0A2P2LMT1_RHIMU